MRLKLINLIGFVAALFAIFFGVGAGVRAWLEPLCGGQWLDAHVQMNDALTACPNCLIHEATFEQGECPPVTGEQIECWLTADGSKLCFEEDEIAPESGTEFVWCFVGSYSSKLLPAGELCALGSFSGTHQLMPKDYCHPMPELCPMEETEQQHTVGE